MTVKRTDIVNKRLTSVLFSIVVSFVFFTQTVSAQVVINEVQVAPTAERFVELYNSSEASVDLTGWYIQRKTETGSSFSSFVTSTVLEGKTIPSHNYFLISRSGLQGSHVVVDSMTLTNSNTLRLRNAKGEDVDIVVLGVVDEGKSYQKNSSGSWSVSTPTPGAANAASSESISSPSNSQEVSANTTTSVVTPSDLFAPTMYARISVRSGSITSGAPTMFLGEAVFGSKKYVDNAAYRWSFGDGETGFGKEVSHVFRYPGEYLVYLEVSSSGGGEPVMARTKVTVVPANLRVVMKDGDPQVVSITNEGAQEVDLSSWVLESGYRRFTIPEHTMILAKGTIILAPSVTGFREPISLIALLYPNWQRYEQAKDETQKETISRATPSVSRASSPSKILNSVNSVNTSHLLDVDAAPQDQAASIVDAFSGASPKSENGMWVWYTSGVLLGALALLGLRFVRGSETKNTFTAEDFEIIEDVDDASVDDFDKNEPH